MLLSTKKYNTRRRRITSKSSVRPSNILRLLPETYLFPNLHDLYFVLLRGWKVFLRPWWRKGVGIDPWMFLWRSGAFSFACCSYGRSGTNHVRRSRHAGSMTIQNSLMKFYYLVFIYLSNFSPIYSFLFTIIFVNCIIANFVVAYAEACRHTNIRQSTTYQPHPRFPASP